jgi:glycosyltransferase involved in cell wall biosynthesis
VPQAVKNRIAAGGFGAQTKCAHGACLRHGMKISIVIPAFNEELLLPGTLKAVRAACHAFDAEGWETEIIVCDNNSSDATAAVAGSAGAQVVFEPVNQIGRARNRGAAAASGEWLVFLDADSCPSRELFADVAAAIKSGSCLAGGATVAMQTGHLHGRLAVGLWNLISRTMRWMAGSFIFCDAAVFRQLGGFHPELYVSEEIELSSRLKKVARANGRRIIILTRHPLRTSARKLELYHTRDYLWLLARMILSAGRACKQKEACGIWYDGRR